MTNLESLYWSEEFSDMELHAIANAGDSFPLTQTEPLCVTCAEWFENNRDTQW